MRDPRLRYGGMRARACAAIVLVVVQWSRAEPTVLSSDLALGTASDDSSDCELENPFAIYRGFHTRTARKPLFSQNRRVPHRCGELRAATTETGNAEERSADERASAVSRKGGEVSRVSGADAAIHNRDSARPRGSCQVGSA